MGQSLDVLALLADTGGGDGTTTGIVVAVVVALLAAGGVLGARGRGGDGGTDTLERPPVEEALPDVPDADVLDEVVAPPPGATIAPPPVEVHRRSSPNRPRSRSGSASEPV